MPEIATSPKTGNMINPKLRGLSKSEPITAPIGIVASSASGSSQSRVR